MPLLTKEQRKKSQDIINLTTLVTKIIAAKKLKKKTEPGPQPAQTPESPTQSTDTTP
jgi:hypothetical protein